MTFLVPPNLKPKLAMNRANPSLLIIVLISIAIAFTWTSPFNTAIANAENTSASNPKAEQPESSTAMPPEVKSAVLNDAVKRTSKTISALKIIEARSQQWSDGCLGLAKPDEICTQAIVPGWQVVVTDGLRNWTYRTDEIGNTVRLEELE